MPHAAELIRLQLKLAFDGRPDMSLMGALAGITEREASWTPVGFAADPSSDHHEPIFPTVDEIVRHVAWSKSRYCQQTFGTAMPFDDSAVDSEGDTESVAWEMPCGCAWGREAHPGVAGAIGLLHAAQTIVLQCLRGYDGARLSQPIDGRHGSTAGNFFVTIAIHDTYHAGQIRTRRTLAGMATHHT